MIEEIKNYNSVEFFNNTPIAFQSLDFNGCFIDINPFWLKELGYEKNEVLGKWFGDFLHPDYVEHFKLNFPKLKEDGVVHGVEFKIRKNDGTYIEISFEGKIGYNDDGSFKQIFCIFRNITKEKKSEQALEESEELFRTVFEQALVGIALLNADGTFLKANDRFCGIVGYTKEELEKIKFNDITYSEDKESSLLYLKNIINNEIDSFVFEKRYVHKSGNIIWANLYTKAVRDGEGKVKYFLSALTDISGRKYAEESLKKSEENFRALFENELNAVSIHEFVFDENGEPADYIFLKVNKQFVAQTGLKEKDVIGKRVTEVLPGIEKTNFIKIYGNVVASGKPIVFEDYAAVLNKYYSISAFYLGNKNFAVVFQDITERKIAEEEREKMNQLLEEKVKERTEELISSNKELEFFSYSVSHDLRAPLRHINGFGELLAKEIRKDLGKTTKKYLDNIITSSKKMGVLIDELLEFSRMSRQNLKTENVDLDLLIKEVLLFFKEDIAGRKVECKIEPLCKIKCDASMIRQVFINLISNALKYSKRKNKAVIKVGIFQEKGSKKYITVFVKDNGVGFDPKYSEKLFGVFQRLHSEKDYEGVGVGLAIVHRIITRHGGKVWAEGVPDKGATFYFTLPIER